MNALILAAGYATRLYPLTKNTAKPLLPVGGKKIIEYILKSLSACDRIQNIYVVTNDKFYQSFCDWQRGLDGASKPVVIINDGTQSNEDRLGAIGDIQHVVDTEGLQEDLLVIGGDNLFDCRLTDILDVYDRKGASVVGLYDVKDFELAKQYGLVVVDTDDRIFELVEKSNTPKTTLAATCLYVFTKGDVQRLKEYLATGGVPDAPGYYLEWLVKQTAVYSHVLSGRWFDIGDKEKYNEANDFYKT